MKIVESKTNAEKLVTLRSNNGDVHEKVAEK